ncbi:MAG TPA: T9SS type A sorting domain-containing protein [Chitinophagaceae bacterium]|jgi:hypothetical protein|nr:T9SS type A sorting domain-containing protein [Chitinophagaceae bacterium]
MKRNIALMILGFCIALSSFSQQLPIGTCGIVNVYDAAGNRVRRVYFCNNGIDPYPGKMPVTPENVIEKGVAEKDSIAGKNEVVEFQEVDALYPNPTTGRFSITFSKNLSGALVVIMDISGKVLSRTTATGYKTELDLSPFAAGVYYVRIEDDGKTITKKVVKQ